ncbi:hypothetical protein WAF17_01715 [Bernardetia sp. ABR2-2B]|uniref:hypothetical protein n=1 Tax=Bernardetia sp. ABR2-2B TaxID=3127472 RepID=UPI0030D31089
MKKNNCKNIFYLLLILSLGLIEYLPVGIINIPSQLQENLYKIPPIFFSLVSLFSLITIYFISKSKIVLLFVCSISLSILYSSEQKSIFLGSIKNIKQGVVTYSWFNYFDTNQDLCYKYKHGLSSSNDREIIKIYDKNWFSRTINLLE